MPIMHYCFIKLRLHLGCGSEDAARRMDTLGDMAPVVSENHPAPRSCATILSAHAAEPSSAALCEDIAPLSAGLDSPPDAECGRHCSAIGSSEALGFFSMQAAEHHAPGWSSQWLDPIGGIAGCDGRRSRFRRRACPHQAIAIAPASIPVGGALQRPHGTSVAVRGLIMPVTAQRGS